MREKEIKVLTERGKQYQLSLPKAVVHRLFKKEMDGRYYVRVYIEDGEIRISPPTMYSKSRGLNPLEELDRLQRMKEERDSVSGS